LITLDEYFQGRDKDKVWAKECTIFIRSNAEMLLDEVNKLLEKFGSYPVVTSGWRPAAINERVGGSPKSKHITGNAIDLGDLDGSLKKWCVENIEELIKLDLYMEQPSMTPTWVHLQRIPPRSKSRIFVP
jgi:hypothetical protein